MMSDIFTILQKELKEMLFQRSQGRGSIFRLLILVGVFGIVLPLQNGVEFLESPASLFFWAWIPYLMVSGVTADTFAGERERHTLETLLASRLSDRAVLFGKLAAVVAYGWGITLLTIFVNAITLNLVFWQGTIIFYPLALFAANLIISLLVAIFSAGLGVVVSLRSATVRSAQQTLSLLMFAFMIPIFALSFLPRDVLLSIDAVISGLSLYQFIAGAILGLALFDAALVLYALANFKRTKLIND